MIRCLKVEQYLANGGEIGYSITFEGGSNLPDMLIVVNTEDGEYTQRFAVGESYLLQGLVL